MIVAVLYSTHCPKCNVLEKKLLEKHVDFTVNTDEAEMIEKGFESVPVLEVDGKYMDFAEAVKWANEVV